MHRLITFFSMVMLFGSLQMVGAQQALDMPLEPVIKEERIIERIPEPSDKPMRYKKRDRRNFQKRVHVRYYEPVVRARMVATPVQAFAYSFFGNLGAAMGGLLGFIFAATIIG